MLLFDHPWELGLLLLVLLALVLDLGRWFAARYTTDLAPSRKEQMGTIRDGLFILVSFLLGFTLTLAGSRFGERRSLLVEEAVSIGTTYLRADTLPQPYRDHSKRLLGDYVDERLKLDEIGADLFHDAASRSREIHKELWLDAAAVAKDDRSALTAVYLNSLNETIDLDEKRVAAFENRIPPPIWILIISISCIAVFTRGSTLTARFWLTTILVPITIAIVVALIADLDTPSRGLIRLDQRAMQRLKADMAAETER
ncbi:MAG: hypothetical protein DMG81_18265 [Acidobacteria bacterium]|nr:MAG: hypothetical protein DMG81_18265 [Acidobacteriota bacterium]